MAVSDRLALTNCHVIGSNKLIIMIRGEKAMQATAWAGDQKRDTCVLESETPMVAVGGTRSSDTLEI